jgi:hypothetical protein
VRRRAVSSAASARALAAGRPAAEAEGGPAKGETDPGTSVGADAATDGEVVSEVVGAAEVVEDAEDAGEAPFPAVLSVALCGFVTTCLPQVRRG